MRDDTIVAIATPPGEGGVGIVRLSGSTAEPIARRVFRGRLRDRRAVFGQITDPGTGEPIDEALALLMRAPRTYTREDTVELQAHGSPVVLRRIVELCLREGARLAEPGEFTLRAFLNGRLDLAQAEAVLDLIQARTDAARRLAVQGLGGRLSGQLRGLRVRLLDLLAYLSARADFPDEDVPPDDITPRLARIAHELDSLLATADAGLVYRQGAHVAIAGRPNAGKSSLLNRLLREERAIVTSIAGTTRDTVEETANFGGVPVVLTDTAGLTESADAVERIGVARSHEVIARSDAVLIVLDGSRPLCAEELELLRATESRPRLVVINKCDLVPDPSLSGGLTALRVSALTGTGVDRLEQLLAELVTGGQTLAADTAIVTHPRHKAVLQRAAASIAAATGALESGLPEDLAAVDLRAAVEAIGEVTGDQVTEDLLDSIFRNFCIGK